MNGASPSPRVGTGTLLAMVAAGFAVRLPTTPLLLTALVGDPILGHHLLSAAASVLTAWPLALVARAWALSLGYMLSAVALLSLVGGLAPVRSGR